MQRTVSMPDQHRRTSPMARAACFVYALLLLYSGWAPWSGWRDLGIDAFAYLFAPLPRYITTFDLLVNILAYVPLGALIVLALYPRPRGIGVALAIIGGVLLSAVIEAGQTYLPTRVSSNVDLLTNTVGTVAGALLASAFAAPLIDHGRLADWRHRWFDRNTTIVLIAMALWPAAQIYPEPMLFGNGDLRSSLEPLLLALGGHWWQFEAVFGPAEFVLAEAFVVASALLAVGLGFSAAMRKPAPRYRLLAILLLTALTAKSIANAVQFAPERALAWLTPGMFGGMALGVLSLAAALGGTRAWQMRLAWIALLLLLLAVNATPENPYHLAQLQEWRHGRLLNFNEMAGWLSSLWPLVLALGLALRGTVRE